MFNRPFSFTAQQHSELTKIFIDLLKTINDALLLARDNNKKLLLIAGEKHSQAESLLMQIMLLLACRECGINQLAAEYSEDFIQSFLSSPRKNKSLNTEFSIPFAARELKFRIVPTDLGIDQLSLPTEEKDSLREEKMITTCIQLIHDNALFIIGSIHIQPLLKQLADHFHVLAVNISANTLFDKFAFRCIKLLNSIDPAILHYGPADLGERHDFSMDTKKVKQIPCTINLDNAQLENIIPAIKQWHASYLQSRMNENRPPSLR